MPPPCYHSHGLGGIVCAGLALGVYGTYQAYQRLVAPAAATAAGAAPTSAAQVCPSLSEQPGQEALASQPTTGQPAAPDQRLEQGGWHAGTFLLGLLAVCTTGIGLSYAPKASPATKPATHALP